MDLPRRPRRHPGLARSRHVCPPPCRCWYSSRGTEPVRLPPSARRLETGWAIRRADLAAGTPSVGIADAGATRTTTDEARGAGSEGRFHPERGINLDGAGGRSSTIWAQSWPTSVQGAPQECVGVAEGQEFDPGTHSVSGFLSPLEVATPSTRCHRAWCSSAVTSHWRYVARGDSDRAAERVTS